MKTNLEKLFNKYSAPYKRDLKKAEREYEKFLKEFIQDTLTGKNGFKEAYEDGEELYFNYLYIGGSLPKNLYPKIKVMEFYIDGAIIDFETMLEDDPIANKGL